MIILGVDTSLPLLSAALLRDDLLVGALSLEGKGSRNEKLLPAIDWLLSEAAVAHHAIDLFAVTRGPGSFTGVRIGLATIQGLALVLGRPVCAMSTHEAIAAAFDDRVTIVDEAGRGEFYVSSFDRGREVAPPRLATAAERDALPGRIVNAGEFTQHDNVGAGAARRALRASREGELDRFADATPIYVRLAEAEVKLRQKRSE